MSDEDDKIVRLKDRGRPHREIDDPQKRLERIELMLLAAMERGDPGVPRLEKKIEALHEQIEDQERQRQRQRQSDEKKANWRGQRFVPNSRSVSTPKRSPKKGTNPLLVLGGLFAAGFAFKKIVDEVLPLQPDELDQLVENPRRPAALAAGAGLSTMALDQIGSMLAETTREVHHHHQGDTVYTNVPVPGPSGRQGKTGAPGPRGLRGKPGKGKRGSKGERGRSGRDGRNGQSGRDGRDGRDGRSELAAAPKKIKKTILD